MKIRRINLWGGPGVGKSTLAARLFSELKAKGYSVELTPEFIKQWAYEGKKSKSYDQLFVFASQLHSEDRLLPYVDMVVSDSPILLVAAYCQLYGFDYYLPLVEVAQSFEEKYPSLNFWVPRQYEFKSEGRYQNQKQAFEADEKILKTMNSVCPVERTYYEYETLDEVLNAVESHS